MLTLRLLNNIVCIALYCMLVSLSLYAAQPWWVFLLPAGLWFVITALGSGSISSGYFIKALCSNPAVTGNKIAITFDDGPHPETLNVLRLLKQYNMKATFFCIGSRIEKHPEIIRQVINDGHCIGNHSYSHSNFFGFFSTARITSELLDTNALIEKYTGTKPRLFRPPFGATSPSVAKAVKNTGLQVIGWNIRSLDTVIKSEQKILKRITKRLAPGSIVLLHDTSQKSLAVLEQLLVFLQQHNYKAVSIPELFNNNYEA